MTSKPNGTTSDSGRLSSVDPAITPGPTFLRFVLTAEEVEFFDHLDLVLDEASRNLAVARAMFLAGKGIKYATYRGREDAGQTFVIQLQSPLVP